MIFPLTIRVMELYSLPLIRAFVFTTKVLLAIGEHHLFVVVPVYMKLFSRITSKNTLRRDWRKTNEILRT